MSAAVGTKEWHAERRQGIGGSDAAGALGLSKWMTPYQLYLQKIGEAEPTDENWEMARGKIMEPLLRQHYADTTGRTVMMPKGALVSSKYPFMRYNPDGLTEDRLQEFKTSGYGHGWGEAGSDEIPQEYLLQVQHGMIVTERMVSDVTVSIAGGRPKYFVVEADRELQEMIIDGEAKFWDMVQKRTPPEPTTNDDVAKMYKKVNGASVVISPTVGAILSSLHHVREGIKSMEEDKETLEVQIKAYMGENEILLAEDAHTVLATWKQQKGAARIDSKTLRENEPSIAAAYTLVGEPTRKLLLK